MEILQLLNSIELNHFGQTYDISLNWIGKIIEWIISGIGIVGVGVIVFSLILKFIVLPFDIFQRISMRKQNNKMKENQEKMEKLQKQYANDKEKYNQKVMEMYKANGISMFSSCLPMILSMVVFFAAIGGFNAYSKYANIQNYNGFVQAYNAKIESYAPDTDDASVIVTYNASTEEGKFGTFTIDDANKTVYYTVEANYDASAQTQEEQIAYINSVLKYEQFAADGNLIQAKYFAKVDATYNHPEFGAVLGEKTDVEADKLAVKAFYSAQAQQAVKVDYEANSFDRVGFLWVKNVWNVDAVYESPLTEYEKLMQPVKSLFGGESKFDMNGVKRNFNEVKGYNGTPYSEAAYGEITASLGEAKDSPNGYFILIALSIGTILLQQFITMRSQKAQNKYSSVDGQQAMTQKTTMIVMTLMFGIFAFMYSSAFSIYMITSSIFSLLSTMLINKLVDISMNKKEAQAMQEKYTRTLPGRKQPEPKNKKKK